MTNKNSWAHLGFLGTLEFPLYREYSTVYKYIFRYMHKNPDQEQVILYKNICSTSYLSMFQLLHQACCWNLLMPSLIADDVKLQRFNHLYMIRNAYQNLRTYLIRAIWSAIYQPIASTQAQLFKSAQCIVTADAIVWR